MLSGPRVTLVSAVLLFAGAACAQTTDPVRPIRTDSSSASDTREDPSPVVDAFEWPGEHDGRSVSFASVDDALSFLRRHMEMQIALPDWLPPGTHLGRGVSVYIDTEGGERSAQLNLIFGQQRHLIVQYGVSQLDGCAPEHSVAVRVSGQPARLRVSPAPWSELIWPATLAHPEGVYGLTGSFRRRTILAMAETMPPVTARVHAEVGC